MSRWTLVKPAKGAPQVWFEAPGVVPELVAPPVKLRRKFGDFFDWGAGAAGCRLTAATLLYRLGLPVDAAIWFAPIFAEEVLLPVKQPVARFDHSELEALMVEMVHVHGATYAASTAERRLRRARK